MRELIAEWSVTKVGLKWQEQVHDNNQGQVLSFLVQEEWKRTKG